MPNSTRETVLCRYHYDPLDRQNGCTVPEHPLIQRFHCDDRLTTEIQGGMRWSILQHGDQLLAQRNHLEASVTATLLATDQQRSVLNAPNASGPHPLAYTPYGHHPAVDRLLSRCGFNGEQPDPLTGHYHLGNGYRQYNPVLMRFTSPDSWSPFGEGGLNAYGYCEGEPVLRVDRNGHAWGVLKALGRQLGLRSSAKNKLANSFNAGLRRETASSLFSNKFELRSRIPTGQPRQTASMNYVKQSNNLYLLREVEYKNFSFTTQVRINSKFRALSGEDLSSITPSKNLELNDPGTFNYITKISEHLKSYKYLMTKKDLNSFRHPIEMKKIREIEELMSNRPSGLSRWFGGE